MSAFAALEKVSFADGEIEEVKLDWDGLVVLFCDWREKGFEFVFANPHRVSALYAFGAPLERLEVVSNDPMLDKVVGLLRNEGLPESAWVSLHRVNFICADLDPHPVLAVIADGVEVRELEDGVG